MCVLNPHVHMLGDDAAVIAYTTLTQRIDKSVLCCSLPSSSSSSSRNEYYLGGIIALLLQDHPTMSTESVCSNQ